jgi:5'-methylthioadenosine phosphorylase
MGVKSNRGEGKGCLKYGIIGGTGLYEIAGEKARTMRLDTEFGPSTAAILKLAGEETAFIARHAPDHSLLPHEVNYRANIMALKQLGVERVLATATVGSLNDRFQPGDLVVLSQFLDFTKGRAYTLFEGKGRAVHVDMTEPYCPHLRDDLLKAGARMGEVLHPAGTYVCTEGPRFETAAEVAMFRALGGDVVGMTGVPEVVLAREANMCYAGLAVATNWAPGISQDRVSHEEVVKAAGAQFEKVRRLLEMAIQRGRERSEPCSCQQAAPA